MVLPLLVLIASSAVAAQQLATPPKAEASKAGVRDSGQADPADEKPAVTKHSIKAAGKELKYTVTTGKLPIRNAADETEADMFFVAYTLDGEAKPGARPLMFSFNGGPGSSSVWLHLGALGPKRVKMLGDGRMPPPPFETVDNEHTWLDQTDLVFIDPVGTGYSRPRKPELGKKFWGVEGDIESVGEFIRLYLGRYERWASPLFLVGESYGTTRAAGLAGHLIEKGIAFNGILLISSILNFQTARFMKGNDLPYVLFLPTYTATAWYHKKLPGDLQKSGLRRAVDESKAWAASGYAEALAKGDRLTPGERADTMGKLSRYTGIERRYLDQVDLRVEIQHFIKELLRNDKKTVGRLDSRFEGIDELAVSETPDFDPAMAIIRPPYTAAFNDYVRRELNYKSDMPYHILGGGIGSWNWGSAGRGYADVSEALRAAFAKNPYMKLFVGSGYFDLATPFFATEYTLSHMGLDPSLRKNITIAEYEAGHMMYIHDVSLEKLRRDVAGFLRNALPAK